MIEDFPEPVCPIMPMHSPPATSNETSSSATVSPGSPFEYICVCQKIWPNERRLIKLCFVFCNLYLLRYYPYYFSHEKEIFEYYGFCSCDVNYGKVISYSYSNGIFNSRYINVRGRIHVQSCMEKL